MNAQAKTSSGVGENGVDNKTLDSGLVKKHGNDDHKVDESTNKRQKGS